MSTTTPTLTTWAAIAESSATTTLTPRPARTTTIAAAVASIAIGTIATCRLTLARRCQFLFRRRRKQRLTRQTNLAGIRLDADHLHLDFIAELEEIRHLADARVRHFGDVQQS